MPNASSQDRHPVPWAAGLATVWSWTRATLALWMLLGVVASSACAQGFGATPMYLYVSPTTERYLQSQGRYYGMDYQRWRKHLKKYGELAKEVAREQLLSGLPPGVLILPAAVALDPQERTAIRQFAAQGGALLGSGLVGTRDALGQAVGLDFLHSTFHVRSHGFFPPSEDGFFMPFGDGPLTWTIPAARRMPLSVGQDTVLRIEADSTAAVAMDWARSKQTQVHNVAAFHESGSGRVAYFSFPDSAWPYSKDTALLMDATLAWLRRMPQAYKAAWPNGYVASHLIEMDTEDKFFSAPSFAKHLESEGFKGTFYSLTSLAVFYPDMVRDLMRRGHEIAYHADVHFGFKGDAPQEQELRIRFMKQQMQAILGDSLPLATGFRAPTESYDATTEALLRKHGLLHHAADESAHEDRLPFFSVSEPDVAPDKALVVLPRTQLDDVSFMHLKFTPDQVKETLEYDLDLTVRSGAFGLLSVHSQNYIEGGLMLRTMGDYVRKVATYRDRLWVARGDEIAAWWRQRAAVRVDQRLTAEALHVRLETPIVVPGLTVFVTLPHKNAAVRVSTQGSKSSVQAKALDAYRAALVFDAVQPGTTQLRVTFQ